MGQNVKSECNAVEADWEKGRWVPGQKRVLSYSQPSKMKEKQT